MKKQKRKIYVLPTMVLAITVVVGMVSMAPSSSAEDITPIDDEITITVDSACTMGQTVLQSGNSLNPGETSIVGSSRIAAYCNDADGYAIYAIGYTNGEYGNTSMQSTESSHTIPTGLSGEGSYWNMYLTPGTSTTTPSYIPTITNNFTSPSTIPNDYTKVATYPSTTIPQSEDPLLSGSYFTTTYTSHISTTQPAGVYTGQVQYVIVHPQGAPAPIVPYMQTVSQWKDKLLPNTNDTIQAIDKRDGKKYWVTKLADGNIWMTQNLDFDIIAGKTYTSADTDLANSAISTSWTPTASTSTTSSWTSSTTAPKSYDPGNLYWDGTLNTDWDGNLDNETVIDPPTTGSTHYHIGNYYNWTAAVAMSDSGSYASSGTDVNQSICPAGWRLPTYSGDKSYDNLVIAQNLTAGTSGNIQNNPTYFVYGGYWGWNSGNVGGSGYYWSSVRGGRSSAYLLGFGADGSLTSQGNAGSDNGNSLRCVAR